MSSNTGPSDGSDDPFSQFCHARPLTPSEVKRANDLGNLLEDIVGSSLELLKQMGHITDYRDPAPFGSAVRQDEQGPRPS
jgi:hypothetical protein